MVIISGIDSSAIDFPDGYCRILFTNDCNLRCPFCHNYRLFKENKPPQFNETEVICKLGNEKGLIENVVISGGEPTIDVTLPGFITRLNRAGFNIKLDTNGTNLEVLRQSLTWVKYISVDIKTSFHKYMMLGASRDYTRELMATIKTLMYNRPMTTEFRCTVVPGIVDEEDIKFIGMVLDGAENFTLQQFNPSNSYNESFREIKPYSLQKLSDYKDILSCYIRSVKIINI
jgi:pyruvate formate lyase activating enzyme